MASLTTKNLLNDGGATYGETPSFSFKKFKKIDCIFLSYHISSRAGEYQKQQYFNINSHKLLFEKEIEQAN